MDELIDCLCVVLSRINHCGRVILLLIAAIDTQRNHHCVTIDQSMVLLVKLLYLRNCLSCDFVDWRCYYTFVDGCFVDC